MLLERDQELAAFAELIDGGGVLVVEGGAGIGKTSLLDAGCAQARARGWRVVRGCGSQLETGFAFGVVRQLFERELAGADPPKRADLLAGPARAAGELLADGRAERGNGGGGAGDVSFGMVHGLYWLTVNMAEQQPVLVAVDDAHWADGASLRWLAYLAARLDGLRVALLLALRPAERVSGQDPLLAIRAAAPAVRPALLTARAAAEIVRAANGETSDARCDEVWAASGGNPFYLGELLRAAASGQAAGRDPGELAGASAGDIVARRVEERIRRLDPHALGLAQALAVLGDGGKLRHGAVMAGLDAGTAIRLAAGLVRVEVLASDDPPCFLHPIVRAAVEASMASDERHAAHRSAARELDRDGGAAGQVAAHLMHVQPLGDPWVADRLRQAARAEMTAGAPGEAGLLLRRALAEAAPIADRSGILRELASADANAGRATAFEWLDEALALSSDPLQRARIAQDVAHAYAAMFRWAEAVDATDRALDELGDRDPELAAVLQAELAVAAMHDARRASRVAPVISRLMRRAPSAETAEPLAVARLMASVLSGQPAADGDPLDDVLRAAAPSAGSWDTRAALLWTLIAAERFAAVEAALPAMIEAAGDSGSARGLIATYSSLGFLKLRLGALPEADTAMRVALRVLREGDFTAGMGVAAIAAEVAVEAGDLAEAQALLSLIAPGPAGVVSVLAPAAMGRLALARGDGEQALTCFESCLAMFGPELWGMPVTDAGYLHARSGAAQALLLLGDRPRACELAESELADARRFAGRRALGIALRVAGLAGGGTAGVRLIEESVSVLRESPAILERAKSLAEWGAALRRAGQRKAARPLLAEALDLAADCAAWPLADRARAELTAAGGWLRRERLHGAEALTPSEWRVARLAADGRTNRQIAQSLYITLKTVETHLTHAYAKLGISQRGELPDALAGQNVRVPTRTRAEGR